MSVQKYISGSSAVEIAASVEAAIQAGRLRPGARLATVRDSALELGVSPATVSSAWRILRERGLIVTRGRRGSAVADQPPLPPLAPVALPRGVLDLSAGNPDPALLPELGPALRGLDPPRRLYGEDVKDPALVELVCRQLGEDGIPAAHLTVVSGALDGLERVMQVHLRRADRVAVEDPAFSGVLSLLQPLGLVPVPVALDDRGMLPEALERALARGARAVIVTPRAQNPTGAALDAGRARALRAVLRRHPDVLVMEDDHAGPVSGADVQSLAATTARWAVVRSFAKAFGPDLRVAVVAGDAETVARVEGRQLTGMRWVSHVLQQLVVALATARGTAARLRKAAATYERRRCALLAALEAEAIAASGRSGLNVWIGVPEETTVVQQLLEAGYAVSPGARFRLQSPPAIRVTTATLEAQDARRFAEALASVLAPTARTHLS
jgi:DNA-binding transcriptional MocR family regulator